MHPTAPLIVLLVVSSTTSAVQSLDEEASRKPPQPVASNLERSTLSFGDFDDDGLVDVYVVARDGEDRLLRNQGRDVFEDVTAQHGLTGMRGSLVALWQDFDGDGALDLYVANAHGANHLFQNTGAGMFVDVTEPAGLAHDAGAELAAEWLDFDGDARPDLHLVTERGDLLFAYRGRGRFVRVGLPLLPSTHELLQSTVLTTSAPTTVTQSTSTSGSPAAAVACQVSIQDAATGSCIKASSTPTLGWLHPMSTYLNVSSAGNVGVGTTAPSTKLEVIGDIRASGTSIATTLEVSSSAKVANLNVDLLDSFDSTAFRKVAEPITSVDILDGTVSGSDLADGSITGSDIAVASVPPDRLGSAAGAFPGAPLKWDGSSWVPGIDFIGPWAFNSSGIHYNAGRVGIGTSSPGTTLHVVGGNSLTPGLVIENADLSTAALCVSNTISGGQAWYMSSSGPVSSGGAGNLEFGVHFDNPRLLVTPSGNVGIGTSVPAARLDIQESIPSQTAVRASNGAATGRLATRGVASDGTALDAGVLGTASGSNPNGVGVVGFGPYGIYGESLNAVGVSGYSENGVGVDGESLNAVGVFGYSEDGVGVLGSNNSPTSDAIKANGNLSASGVKAFVQPHPTDASKVLRFICLEGNEAGTYFRGSAQIVGGSAAIDVPEDFRLASEGEALTVQVTPIGAPALVWVESKCLERIVVRANLDVAFDYFVNGVRRGYANQATIVDNDSYIPTVRGKPFGTQYPQAIRDLLAANGILNADYTPNEATAARLGWELRDETDGRSWRGGRLRGTAGPGESR